MPGARHTACTVEMANLNEEYDVAVIDEIQVLMPVAAHVQHALCGPALRWSYVDPVSL